MRKKAGQRPEVLSADGLSEVYEELVREHGPERLYWGTDERLTILKLPLGIDSIDRALGGGFAFGRMALLYGEWSSGKSLIALFAVKAAQEQGLSVAYVDVERTFDPEWARLLGVDIGRLLVSQPRTGEEAFAVVKGLCEARVGVVVLDSLVACVPAILFEDEKNPIAARARLLSQELPQVNATNDTTAVVLINQQREGIGSYGDPTVLPGGKAQHFFPSLKVSVRRGDWIEEKVGEPTKPGGKPKKKRVGFNLKVVVVKNKQGGSHQYDEGEAPFLFSGVIDVVAGLVPLALDVGIIRQDGANYYIPVPGGEPEKVYGRRNLVEYVSERPEVQERIREELARVPEF